jgi:hypothetical protein
MALSVLDTAVKKIHDALDDVGMLGNTYFIFMYVRMPATIDI